MTKELKLIITPRRSALVRGHANSVDALIRLQAPEQPKESAAKPRTKLNIALVIDRSGSMAGEPIREAKNAAKFVVEHLGQTDRCAIVVYDDRVDTLMPATPVEDKNQFFNALKSLTSRGSTDLHQGWLQGAETLAPYSSETAISRVILLSDGNANAGLVDDDAICLQVARLAASGVTTSTLGLGRDFNERLMTSMARSGRGRCYYGETAADLLGPFREEFDLLAAIAARKIACLLKPARDVGVEVLNGLAQDDKGRHILPDVAWNSETVLAVRLTVPAEMTQNETLFELLSVSIAAVDSDGRPIGLASDPLVLPVVDAAAYSALAEDEIVARRFDEITASKIQTQAREAALNGDWAVVDKLLAEIQPLANRNPWIAEILKEIKSLADERDVMRFSKETMYASHSMSDRLSVISESPELVGEGSRESFLARKLRHGKARKPH